MTPEDQSRSEFEAYIRKDCGDLSTFGSGQNMHYRNSGVNHEWLGWQASRRTYRASVLEEAAEICEGEYLNEPQSGTEDIAYDHAVLDCVSAIRALAAQAQKDKPC